jgi:hypothetical protein
VKGGIPQPGQKGGRTWKREREGKGNGPYNRPSWTSGKITERKKTKVDGRRMIKKGNLQGRK